jgi:hypothetical protein
MARPYGLIVRLVVKENRKILRVYPVYTNNLETDYQLRFLDEDELEDCYNYFSSSNLIKLKKTKYEFFEIIIG